MRNIAVMGVLPGACRRAHHTPKAARPKRTEIPSMKAALPALAALAALATAPALAAPSPNDPTIEKVVAGVSAARIKANIRKLASFGTRNSLSDTESDTRGIGAARRWIKAELERCAADSAGRLQVAF